MKRNDLAFYDRHASQWWNADAKIYALYHLNQPRFEFFDRYVSNWCGLKVLDVGCGGGYTCEFLAARGAQVCGIDQSQACIAAAQHHASTSGFAIDYRCGVAEQLPYADQEFDVVICVDVLEHVADVKQVVTEISRILKPKGLFCFDTINRNFKSRLVMIWLMETLLGEIERGVHDWRKFIKPAELRQLLEQTGFAEVEIKGFDLFGKALRLNFSNYFKYKRTGSFDIDINEDTSINYIGKALKLED